MTFIFILSPKNFVIVSIFQYNYKKVIVDMKKKEIMDASLPKLTETKRNKEQLFITK